MGPETPWPLIPHSRLAVSESARPPIAPDQPRHIGAVMTQVLARYGLRPNAATTINVERLR